MTLHRTGVRSLTVNEPPAFGIVREEPAVARWIEQTLELWTHGPQDPAEFLRAFLAAAGSEVQPPNALPPPLIQNAQMLRNARPPWEADIPLDTLRGAPFPKLVISGGHSPAFDTVCDALQTRLSARREVVVGAGHSVRAGHAVGRDVRLIRAEGPMAGYSMASSPGSPGWPGQGFVVKTPAEGYEASVSPGRCHCSSVCLPSQKI